MSVVGCGLWGPKLARNRHDLSETELAWVADFRPERPEHLPALYSRVRTTENYADILAADVDAVVMARPVSTHSNMAMQTLRADKHVLFEKPIAASVAAAEETAESLGLMAIVGRAGRSQKPFAAVSRRSAMGASR